MPTYKGMTTCTPIDEERVRALQAAGHPFVISYGVGVDSTAVLVGLWEIGLRPDAILFADVGAEKDATYAYLAIINTWLRSVGFPEVSICTYPTAAETKCSRKIDPRTGEPYTDLEGQCWAQGNLPSLAYGSGKCSIKWKGDAQLRWLKAWPVAKQAWADGKTVVKVIGYDCGTADMKRGTKCQSWEPELFNWAYPLRWWGWSREECEEQIADAGLPVPMKSSCIFCPAMKPAEVRWLAENEPHNLQRVLDLEAQSMAAAEANPYTSGGKLKNIELGGLWTRISPGKEYPNSWRVFCEQEGLTPLLETQEAA